MLFEPFSFLFCLRLCIQTLTVRTTTVLDMQFHFSNESANVTRVQKRVSKVEDVSMRHVGVHRKNGVSSHRNED